MLSINFLSTSVEVTHQDAGNIFSHFSPLPVFILLFERSGFHCGLTITQLSREKLQRQMEVGVKYVFNAGA